MTEARGNEVSTGSGSDRVMRNDLISAFLCEDLGSFSAVSFPAVRINRRGNTEDFAEGRREIEIQSIPAQRVDFRNEQAFSIPSLPHRVPTRRWIGDYEHSQS